jgi:hypothetical protein
MQRFVQSPHPPSDCAERLRAAIAEPGVRKIAEHEGEWPVYGRASSDQFYLGAIEKRFGVQGRSRLSALGHIKGEMSEREDGDGASIQIESERPKRYRWVAVLMFVALLPMIIGAMLRVRTAWGQGDMDTLAISGLFVILELLVLAVFLSPWGFGRVRKEDQQLLDCLLAVCEARVLEEDEASERAEPGADAGQDVDSEPEESQA